MDKRKVKEQELMREAQAYCDTNDKSTEFMIQYMADFAGVGTEDVIKFLQNRSDARSAWEVLGDIPVNEDDEIDEPFYEKPGEQIKQRRSRKY